MHELGKSFTFSYSDSLEHTGSLDNMISVNNLSGTELQVMALCRKWSSALKGNTHQGPDVVIFMEHCIPEEVSSNLLPLLCLRQYAFAFEVSI